MNENYEQLKREVEELNVWKKQMEYSNSIPSNVDQALVGRGFNKNKLIFTTATLDFASTLNNASASLTVGVGGANLNDPCVFSPTSLQEAGRIFSAYVSAVNVVTVRFDNRSGGTLDLGAFECVILVIQK